MKKVKVLFIFIVTAAVCALYTSLTYTQQGTTTEKKEVVNEAEAPDDSYLAKFQAIRVVDRLIEDNLNDIYMLNVIVSNFSEKGWKGDYDKIYDGYKKAMENYYKRNIIQSRVGFEKNKADIIDLLKKMIVEYKKDATDMLDKCTGKILMLHLDAATRIDPDKNDSLHLNQMRLRIAYGQLDDSVTAEKNHYYKGSIFHLRVAKSQAIRIMEELATPDERKTIQDTYKKHKADNMNRILGASAQQQSGQK